MYWQYVIKDVCKNVTTISNYHEQLLVLLIMLTIRRFLDGSVQLCFQCQLGDNAFHGAQLSRQAIPQQTQHRAALHVHIVHSNSQTTTDSKR